VETPKCYNLQNIGAMVEINRTQKTYTTDIKMREIFSMTIHTQKHLFKSIVAQAAAVFGEQKISMILSMLYASTTCIIVCIRQGSEKAQRFPLVAIKVESDPDYLFNVSKGLYPFLLCFYPGICIPK
jgi:hypothetical protein